MQLLSKDKLAALEKKFGGHPIDLVVLVLYKGVWGTVEVVSGLVLLVLAPVYAHSAFAGAIVAAIRQEVVEDPQDAFFHYVYVVTQRVTVGGVTHLGYFVIVLGVIKCLTAAALWSRSHFARLVGLIFFCGVGIYGTYRLALQFNVIIFCELIIDLAVAYYFWKIFPKHLPAKAAVRPTPVIAAKT